MSCSHGFANTFDKGQSFIVMENDSAMGLLDPNKEPPKEATFLAMFAMTPFNQIRHSIVTFPDSAHRMI